MCNSLLGLGLSIALLTLKVPKRMYRETATQKPGSRHGNRTSGHRHVVIGAKRSDGSDTAASTQGLPHNRSKLSELILGDFGKDSSLEGGQALEQALWGTSHVPKLPESKEHLDSTLRRRV